jgi:Tfp pilus assembly protein PilO
MKLSTFFHPTLRKAYKGIPPVINLKSKKQRSYLALTLSLFTLSFFGLFAIRPTLITAFSLFKSNTDLKKLSIEYENKIGSLIRAQSEYEQIRNDTPLILNAIPPTTNFNKMAMTIERFAERENVIINQLQIDSVFISQLPSTGKLNNFGFSMIGIGNYLSLTSFISHLLNHQRIIKIDSLEFAKEGGTVSSTLRMNLKGTTYYEP